ncbi:tetratricopeptide repeat protein [Denitromonas sp.]|uniref:tetratricopeptide repeat protein n=1 Tax=Denitromonas sp. TaxID=2734609 RepID=UPI002AFEE405|nr:tetratricopeptide repeat protein [Denitromonas sp.]
MRAKRFVSIRLVTALMLSCLASLAAGQELPLQCGVLASNDHPLDYRIDKDKLPIVENRHFDPLTERLVRGQTTSVGGDIGYTLGKFPNHHRALIAMMNLGLRDKTSKPRGARYSVECYMRRAEAFRNDDAMVKMIYGLYLLNDGRAEAAIKKLEAAQELSDNNPNLYYNLGLAYFDLKRYDRALESAHKAYSLGFPLPGLRDKLKRAGQWQDPVPAAPDAAMEKPSDS